MPPACCTSPQPSWRCTSWLACEGGSCTSAAWHSGARLSALCSRDCAWHRTIPGDASSAGRRTAPTSWAAASEHASRSSADSASDSAAAAALQVSTMHASASAASAAASGNPAADRSRASTKPPAAKVATDACVTTGCCSTCPPALSATAVAADLRTAYAGRSSPETAAAGWVRPSTAVAAPRIMPYAGARQSTARQPVSAGAQSPSHCSSADSSRHAAAGLPCSRGILCVRRTWG